MQEKGVRAGKLQTSYGARLPAGAIHSGRSYRRRLHGPSRVHPNDNGPCGPGKSWANANIVKESVWFPSLLPDLKAYHDEWQRSSMVSCDAAYAQKSRPTSEMVGLEAWDTMRDLESLQLRIEYVNNLHDQLCGDLRGNATRVRVARSILWSGNLWALRRLLLPMLIWDKHIGICRCYMLYKGSNHNVVKLLGQIPSLQVHFIDEPFASPVEQEAWRNFTRRTNSTHFVGVYMVMAQQYYLNTIAIYGARKLGFQWLAHMDDDELILPSSSLADELAAVPPHIGSLLLNNQEAQAEAVDVVNRFEQVTLFRSHKHAAMVHAASVGWKFRYGDWGGWWMSYENGKSLVRVDGPQVQPYGPHLFSGPDHKHWYDPVHNPNSNFLRTRSNGTVLLHYTWVSWVDVMRRAGHACPARYRQAALTNNDTALDDCFHIDFDVEAYKAAVRGGVRQAQRFWVTNALYSEGLFVITDDGPPERCRVYPKVRWLKEQLVRAGAFRQINAVRETLRAHELALRQLARARGVELPPLGALPPGEMGVLAAEAIRRMQR